MNPLILLFTLLNATLLYAAGGVPAYPSTGYFVMYLNVTLGPSAAFQGPFGTRDSTPFTAGEFVDFEGNSFGTLLSGSENAVADKSGNVRIDARMSLALPNYTHAYLQYSGVGVFGESNTFYLSFETDSNAYGYLNTMFMFGLGTVTDNFLLAHVFSMTKPPGYPYPT